MRKNKLIIIGSCLLLSAIVYSSVSSLTKSNVHVKGYEHYYNEDSTTEKDVPSSSESIALAHDKDESTVKISDNAVIDTDLNSIGLFVNKEFSLPEDYIPADLVEPDVLFSINYSDEKKLMRSDAAYALEKLFAAAKDDGYTICGVSGYRSYKRQSSIYNRFLRTKGADYTNRYSAKPGYSEHQTGLAIDVSAASIGNRLSETFGNTEEGKWLATHAHEYGYIIRYPQNKADLTGYAYEPWHIRYLGIELATYLYQNNLTLEEYYHYTPPVVEDNADTTAVDVDNPNDIIEDLPSIIDKDSQTNSSNSSSTTDKPNNSDTNDKNSVTNKDNNGKDTSDKNSKNDKDKTKPTEKTNNKDQTSTNKKPDKDTKPSSDKNTSINKKPSDSSKPSTDKKPTTGDNPIKKPTNSEDSDQKHEEKPQPPKDTESDNTNDSTNNNTNPEDSDSNQGGDSDSAIIESIESNL